MTTQHYRRDVLTIVFMTLLALAVPTKVESFQPSQGRRMPPKHSLSPNQSQGGRRRVASLTEAAATSGVSNSTTAAATPVAAPPAPATTEVPFSTPASSSLPGCATVAESGTTDRNLSRRRGPVAKAAAAAAGSEGDAGQCGILRVVGPDAKGILAAFSQTLYGHGCGIVESEQHTDHASKQFFQRLLL
jgi:hypothetical protein